MKRMLTTLAALAVLATAGCGGDDSDPLAEESPSSGSPATVVVGSANFPESVLLMEIYAGALDEAGVETETKPNIGAREAYITGVQDGSIDLIPEYTGNLRLYFDPKASATDPQGVYDELTAALPDGLTVLDYAEAQDKDAVVVTRETADRYSLSAIGDLAPVAGDLTLGGPSEWKTRQTGVPGLKKVYGVEFKDFVELAPGPLTVEALTSGRIDAGNVFTTDPSVAANDLVALEDPESLFASQNVVPLLRTDAATDAVTKALNEVSAQLDTDTLATLVSRVVTDKEDPEDVADDFLTQAGISS